jgi:hypothetical protein
MKGKPDNSFIPQGFELFDLFWLLVTRAFDWGQAWVKRFAATGSGIWTFCHV